MTTMQDAAMGVIATSTFVAAWKLTFIALDVRAIRERLTERTRQSEDATS